MGWLCANNVLLVSVLSCIHHHLAKKAKQMDTTTPRAHPSTGNITCFNARRDDVTSFHLTSTADSLWTTSASISRAWQAFSFARRAASLASERKRSERKREAGERRKHCTHNANTSYLLTAGRRKRRRIKNDCRCWTKPKIFTLEANVAVPKQTTTGLSLRSMRLVRELLVSRQGALRPAPCERPPPPRPKLSHLAVPLPSLLFWFGPPSRVKPEIRSQGSPVPTKPGNN